LVVLDAPAALRSESSCCGAPSRVGSVSTCRIGKRRALRHFVVRPMIVDLDFFRGALA
jgi:hypothetical protein